jgi:hypothetical protein
MLSVYHACLPGSSPFVAVAACVEWLDETIKPVHAGIIINQAVLVSCKNNMPEPEVVRSLAAGACMPPDND